VKEVAATSQDLSAVAAVGLAALDFAAKGGAAPDDWKAQHLRLSSRFQKPKAQLLLVPAPAIQNLVEAVAAGGSCAAPK